MNSFNQKDDPFGAATPASFEAGVSGEEGKQPGGTGVNAGLVVARFKGRVYTTAANESTRL